MNMTRTSTTFGTESSVTRLLYHTEPDVHVIHVVVRGRADHLAEVRLAAQQSVEHDLAQHEVRPGLVGAAVAQAYGAGRALELGVEIEPIEPRVRRIARRRCVQREAWQRTHLPQRRFETD